jgi:CubicO group peptidase (beta-lactamase class C family)
VLSTGLVEGITRLGRITSQAVGPPGLRLPHDAEDAASLATIIPNGGAIMDAKNRLTSARVTLFASISLFACLVVSGPADRAHSQAAPADDSVGARVDKVFSELNKTDSPGCALAVIKSGKIIYERGYGMADLDHNLAITPTTIFHAASLTKQFTAMSIMLLVGQGKLTLDDDVRKYVPELHIDKEKYKLITIGDIFRHISGIRDEWTLITLAGWHLYDDVVTEFDVMNLVTRMRTLDFDPRADFNYSNTGYTLAGIIVERVSGKPLSDFARDNIFVPLGMKNTSIAGTHGQIVHDRAYGYWTTDGHRPFTLGMPNLDVTGPTNLLTTVEDLALWERNFDDKTVGGDDALSQMQKPATLPNGHQVNYGLGLEIANYRGLKVIEHDGRDAGYRAHFMRFPDQHFAVACLCNLDLPDERFPGDLAREVADVFLADQMAPKPPPSPHTEPILFEGGDDDFAKFVGSYYSDEIDTTYKVELQGSGLLITRPRYKPIVLTKHLGPAFWIKDFTRPISRGSVVFTFDDQQKNIDGLIINGDRRIREFPFRKQ